tara:strand:- start:388 stop:786 length:399 start_codon:yes stop_codon:yes gene_type:complete
MGCNTCKQKKTDSKSDNKTNNNENSLIEQIATSNFFIKLIAFFAVLITLPLILMVLLGQVFVMFFLPKSFNKISNTFSNLFKKMVYKYVEIKKKYELKKRKKQFEKNGDYKEGSELLDIEVYEQNNNEKSEE